MHTHVDAHHARAHKHTDTHTHTHTHGTVDAYNLFAAGKKDMAALYFLCAVPLNMLMNHLGRTIGGEIL